MTKNVYLSRCIKEDKHSLIREYLKSTGEAVNIINSDLSSNSLRIVSDQEIYLQNRMKIPTITFIALQSLLENGANPFELKPTDKFKNLLLFQKHIAFHHSLDTKTRSQLSRSVVLMGGIITDIGRRPDFIIGNPDILFSDEKMYYSPEWITTLENSTHFIDPKNYLIQLSPRKMPCSQTLPCFQESPSKLNPLVIVASQSTAESEEKLRKYSQEFSQRFHAQHSRLYSQIAADPQETTRKTRKPSQDLSQRNTRVPQTKLPSQSTEVPPEPVVLELEDPVDEEKEKLLIDIQHIKQITKLQRPENQNTNINASTARKVKIDDVVNFTQVNAENSDDDEIEMECENLQQSQIFSLYQGSQDPLINALL